MLKLSRFQETDAAELAAFLNHIRNEYWSLSSLAYQRRPDRIRQVQAQELVQEERSPGRIGTFLLRRDGRIISMLRIDDKWGDGRVAVFSDVETEPSCQRRGTAWRALGDPCLRMICASRFLRVEADTWSFNRKGIPLYKRVGFRAVPGTGLHLENYLPLLVKQPAVHGYFARHDYLRALRGERSYGWDDQRICGVPVFRYRWERRGDVLRMEVDRSRQRVMGIGTGEWMVRCCVGNPESPYLFYSIHNHGTRPVECAFRVEVGGRRNQGPRRLRAGETVGGALRLTASGRSGAGSWASPTGEEGDTPGGSLAGSIVFRVDGVRIPFPLAPEQPEPGEGRP